jgi:hypothetical protein
MSVIGNIFGTAVRFLAAGPAAPATKASPKTGTSTPQIPTDPPPKVPPGQQALPSYRQQITPLASALLRTERNLANTDIVSYRAGATTAATIRDLAVASPDLSAVVNSYLRTAITDSYTMVAYNMDGTINPDATNLAYQLLRRFTLVPDYTMGFNAFGDLQSLSESLGKELLLYGSASMELVLDKARLPSRIFPVSVTKLRLYEDDVGIRPVQLIGGQETDLDIPTFFYCSIDQDLLTPFSTSMFEAAIQPILADSSFLNDLRRSMQRAIQPRLLVQILEDKVKTSISPEVMNDPVKYAAFMNTLISSLASSINGLEPSDALVGFDSVEYSYLTSEGPGNIADTLKAVQELLNAKLTTGAKALPVMLGHAASGNASSTEALLFTKSANIIRIKLNELYSRAYTLAVRLLGQDCYVEFAYAPIDLRPAAELAAFRSMEQSRVLELLSLGMLADEEACIMLTGGLPPAGYKPLSGTMFQTLPNVMANPASNTSTMGNAGKGEPPAAPTAPKSPKGAKPTKQPVK